MDLTVLKGQNTKKPTTIAKSMPGRMKTKHPFISDFHFLAVTETARPKKSYFDLSGSCHLDSASNVEIIHFPNRQQTLRNQL